MTIENRRDDDRCAKSRSPRRNLRRGVILLVMMGLLAMFGLVAMAFVLTSSQYQRSARVLARVDQQLESPKNVCEQAFRPFIRGSNSAQSVLGVHGVLEGIYGNDGVEGSMSGASAIAGGQLFEFDAPNAAQRTGCILTMTSGNVAGQSTPIVGISSAGRLQALTSDWGMPQSGTYVINGGPFSGMGRGYNPATGRTDRKNASGWEIALLPNSPLGDYQATDSCNVDYTAVDFNSMYLGAVVTDSTTGAVSVMPSLHRPDLIQYWITRQGVANFDALPVALKRAICLRPTKDDHPKFCAGVNAAFNPVSGPLDVDNDGDGIRDGIWVDVGLPVRTTPDGRLCKPLVSYLCIDLDGRFNLNAHGTLAQTDPAYYQGINAAKEMPDPSFVFAGGATNFPRGQGWGAAEINLMPLFGMPNDPAACANYRGLLVGNPGAMLDGRYGDLASGAPQAGFPAADNPMDPSSVRNPLLVNLWFEYHGDYWGVCKGQVAPDAFGSPPDLLGNGAVGLDSAGRPLYASMGFAGEMTASPYKINLSRWAPRGIMSPAPANVPDNPFSPGELERFLRPVDRDTPTLANRLWNLAGGVLLPRRGMITTDSWDVPCPGAPMPKVLRAALPGGRPRHVTDLLVAKGVPPAAWRSLLAPEVLAGMRMDVSRPFGNGRDDNGNGTVDEAEEDGLAADTIPIYTQLGKGPEMVPFDHLNDGNPKPSVPPPYSDRELHARYLYVLMLLVADMDYLTQQLGSRDEACRLIAQWAVNTVDFRDRDSVMTRFAFDPNPFSANGWNPPNDMAHVVFGCEKPELLLTEPIAFHDRRTEDLAGDDGIGTKTDDKDKPDPNFDQKKKPIGSVFVELFNPNSPLDPPSGDFQCDGAGQWRGGVLVNKTTPEGHPVWRIIICKPTATDPQKDPDDPDTTKRPTIDRSVYFVDMGTPPVGVDGNDGKRYYPSAGLSAKFAPIKPGRYMVVGSGDKADANGKYTTYIGERTGADKPDDQTRRIVLAPSADPETTQFQVMDNKTVGGNDLPTGSIQSVVAAVIDSPRRLSVSEPKAGYPAKDSKGGDYSDTTGYGTPFDLPFEMDPSRHPGDEGDMDALGTTGTTPRFRMVHLQRLANPNKAYNASTNPYVTVDSAPLDLTAFNGSSDTAEKGIKTGTMMFASRQRGEAAAAAGFVNNIWSQEPSYKAPVATGGAAVAGHKFSAPFDHTFGYLNKAFGNPVAGGALRGDPASPFPWLTWLNRPFSSQMELLLVPALRSSKLLARVDVAAPPAFGFGFQKDGAAVTPYGSAPWTSPGGCAYTHLLPFFQSGPSAGGGGAQFFRIFDYLNVPSRFVGAQVQATPAAMAGGDHSFHAPFNRIPTLREPGKINLNTIYNREVLDGLTNYFPYPGAGDAFWQRFRQSRGDGTPSNALPSVFWHPFRSFAGGDLVPIDAMQPAREIDATIFRADPADVNKPLFGFESTTACNNSNRNPAFRYQGIEKLGNLVTTRSNVFAIWLTVGYFEVTPWAAGSDAQHPDGYQLGPEIGAEYGDGSRHRAFYIFDRSIPMGFKRGMDLNIEKGVLLRRYIE